MMSLPDALWIHSDRPKTLQSIDTDESRMLLGLINHSRNIPNLLLNGMCGAGKQTLLMALLQEIYGPDVWKRRMEYRTFGTTDSAELNVISSKFHMELTPADVGAGDCDIVQCIIKETAQSIPLHMQESVPNFKVVVLHGADRLTKDAQHGLRRTMEKYQETCRLILMSGNAAYLIEPLRSRCLLVRVPRPSTDTMRKILLRTLVRHSSSLPDVQLETIVSEAEGNIRVAMMSLQTNVTLAEGGSSAVESAKVHDWKCYLEEHVVNVLLSDKDLLTADVVKLRTKLYEVLISCIMPDEIFNLIVESVLAKVRDNVALCSDILDAACTYQKRCKQGNKEIFHIEAFVVRLLKCLREGRRSKGTQKSLPH